MPGLSNGLQVVIEQACMGIGEAAQGVDDRSGPGQSVWGKVLVGLEGSVHVAKGFGVIGQVVPEASGG